MILRITGMRSETIFRVAAIASAIFLGFLGCSFVSNILSSGIYPPIPFLFFYVVLPILALPIYIVLTRFGKWSVLGLWSVFLSITCTLIWELLKWCTPSWCGERDFLHVAKAQVVNDHVFLGALVLALATQTQYILRKRRMKEQNCKS